MATYNVNSVATFWQARYDDRATCDGTYNITQDIDFSFGGIYEVEGEGLIATPDSWIPLGASDGTYPGVSWSELVVFTGTINGNGHTLSNILIDELAFAEEWVSGFIGFAGDSSPSVRAYINDLTIDTIDLYGSDYVGAMIGFPLQVTVDNCHVKNVYFWGMPTYDGGSESQDLYFCGGFAGYSGNDAPSYYTNCTADGIYLQTSTWGCAGFIGEISSLTETHSTITNCSAINVTCTTFENWPYMSESGGFVGDCWNTDIEKCYCEAVFLCDDLLYGGSEFGGFTGTARSGSVIKDCYAITTYDINGVGSEYGDAIDIIGGFVSYIGGADLYNCYSYGSFTIEGTLDRFANAGSFCGYVDSNWTQAAYSPVYIKNCYSYFPLITTETKGDYFGNFIGIIYTRSGYLPRKPTIIDCAYYTDASYGDYAIDTIQDTEVFPPYVINTSYTIGDVVAYTYNPPGDDPVWYRWQATQSFTSSSSFDIDYAEGKWDEYTNSVFTIHTNIMLEDGDSLINGEPGGAALEALGAITGSFGTDEDVADSLADGVHNVYRYYLDSGGGVVSHPYRWEIYPENTETTVENAVWFERSWLAPAYIYPTFVYPGEEKPDDETTIPEPINFYSSPIGFPIEFYERW